MSIIITTRVLLNSLNNLVGTYLSRKVNLIKYYYQLRHSYNWNGWRRYELLYHYRNNLRASEVSSGVRKCGEAVGGGRGRGRRYIERAITAKAAPSSPVLCPPPFYIAGYLLPIECKWLIYLEYVMLSRVGICGHGFPLPKGFELSRNFQIKNEYTGRWQGS